MVKKKRKKKKKQEVERRARSIKTKTAQSPRIIPLEVEWRMEGDCVAYKEREDGNIILAQQQKDKSWVRLDTESKPPVGIINQIEDYYQSQLSKQIEPTIAKAKIVSVGKVLQKDRGAQKAPAEKTKPKEKEEFVSEWARVRKGRLEVAAFPKGEKVFCFYKKDKNRFVHIYNGKIRTFFSLDESDAKQIYAQFLARYDIYSKLFSLEEKLKDPESLKELKRQAERYVGNIEDSTNVVEKAKIIFTQLYQDAQTAGLDLISHIDNLEEEIIDNVRTEENKAIENIKAKSQDISEKINVLRDRLASDETTLDKLDVLILYRKACYSIVKKDYHSALSEFNQILKIGVANIGALEGMIYVAEKLGYKDLVKQCGKAIAESETKNQYTPSVTEINVPDINE